MNISFLLSPVLFLRNSFSFSSLRTMISSNTNSSIPPEEQWKTSPRFLLVVCVHVLNFTVGLSLHSYISTLLLNRRRRLDPSDVFTLNQAAAEIFFMLLAPLHILLNVRSEMWVHKPLGLFLDSGMSVRALLRCVVCLERYVAVVHPLTFLKFRPLRYRVGTCVMVWVGAIPYGIICMFMYPDIPYQVFGVIYFMILSVDIFSCMSIMKKLRRSAQRNADRGGEDGAKRRAFPRGLDEPADVSGPEHTRRSLVCDAVHAAQCCV